MPEAEFRRVFFAFVPDPTCVAELAGQLPQLPWWAEPRLRWLPEINWHITLRFVGDVPPASVSDLLLGLPDIAARHSIFDMSFSTIEVFPSSRRPQVVAATGAAPPLAEQLVEDLEVLCRALDLRPEHRPWRPHMTLARVRGSSTLDLPAQPAGIQFPVRRICLMESVPRDKSQVYIPMRWAPLTDSGL
jgi:2'-5' RNA ligase